MPKLILPDGSDKRVPDGMSLRDMAREAEPGLGAKVVGGKINGEPVDLSARAEGQVEVRLVLAGSDEGLDVLRHSVSHVMADAVTHLYPGTRLGIGPAVKDGFYYDFDLEHRLTRDDLPGIEAEMRAIVDADQAFTRTEASRAEAVQRMEKADQPYKVELLREMSDDRVSFYTHGRFTDMCRGPHLESTARIPVFRLLSVAGAYWRGSEHRPMLQRVYGTAFWSQDELDAHLAYLDEVKQRDHRLLGKALDFYSIDEEIGPGLVLWHPRGALVRHLVEDFWRDEHVKRGYQLVYTPHIASERIYVTSGHVENYSESMYAPMDIDGKPYRVKPMNCPGHIKIFKSQARSYRDLPIRYAELGTVYRYERRGTLQGLLRVRGFTQDDAHIFCTRDQLAAELGGVLDLADFMMKAFGYEYGCFLATRPEKSLGTDEEWDHSTEALREALAARDAAYQVDEGGGVFYGPKIDIKLVDAIGREWQGPTIQVDFNLPKRFDLLYVGPDGAQHEAAIIHRTVLGSMERFIGGLLEHYAGAFPAWLAPEQVRLISITDSHAEYTVQAMDELKSRGIRAHADLRNEKTGFKIREATLQKIPYMLIIGDREVRDKTVSVRHRSEGDLGPCTMDDLCRRLEEEIESRK